MADVAKGFCLTDVLMRSGNFPIKLRPREMSEDQLKLSARWLNPCIAARMSSSDPEQNKAILLETGKELKRKWLERPFDAAALNSMFPELGLLRGVLLCFRMASSA